MNALVERSSINELGMARGSGGTKIAPQSLGEVVRFAEVMAKADIALPKHLRGNPGACMAVAIQALEWEMSPFAVASKSYSVNGTIAYEAQLIAAVVNTRSGIKGRLKYSYTGSGDDLQCTVTGILDDEEYTYTSPPFSAITPKNSPLWKTDPQQQIGYFSARSWARRYVPEVMLGVYDRDEVETFQGPDNAKDITPAKPTLMTRLQTASAASETTASANEGFSQSHVATETGSLSTATSADTKEIPATDSGSSSGELDLAGSAPEKTDTQTQEQPSQEEKSEVLTVSDDDKAFMLEKTRIVVAGIGPDLDSIKAISNGIAPEIQTRNDLVRAKMKSVMAAIKRICTGEEDRDEGLNYIAGLIGCEVREML